MDKSDDSDLLVIDEADKEELYEEASPEKPSSEPSSAFKLVPIERLRDPQLTRRPPDAQHTIKRLRTIRISELSNPNSPPQLADESQPVSAHLEGMTVADSPPNLELATDFEVDESKPPPLVVPTAAAATTSTTTTPEESTGVRSKRKAAHVTKPVEEAQFEVVEISEDEEEGAAGGAEGEDADFEPPKTEEEKMLWNVVVLQEVLNLLLRDEGLEEYNFRDKPMPHRDVREHTRRQLEILSERKAKDQQKEEEP